MFGPGRQCGGRPGDRVGSPADTRDFLTFTIPAGRQLTGLRLVSWGGNNTGFHAINAGATSFVPSTTTDNNFLGGDHIVPIAGPTELLAELLDGDTAGVGTTAPLGPGTYSYVIQQTGPQLSDYRLEFVISAAPRGRRARQRSQVADRADAHLPGGDADRPPPLAPGRVTGLQVDSSRSSAAASRSAGATAVVGAQRKKWTSSTSGRLLLYSW